LVESSERTFATMRHLPDVTNPLRVNFAIEARQAPELISQRGIDYVHGSLDDPSAQVLISLSEIQG
jgi:hypothetical protein